MSDKPEERNTPKEEIDSLKQEIKDLKEKKEFEELKAEVDSLKKENETKRKKKEIASLQAEVDSLNPQPSQYSEPTQPSQYSEPMWDEIKSKRTTTGILGIIFGFLGVHKFLLGYTAEGFILLLITVIGGIVTCGFSIIVTDIIGIIEGIIILSKTPDEFKRTYIDKKTGWF